MAKDELAAVVHRVVACNQLEELLAEIEVQRPDKVSRRGGAPSEGGLSEYSLLDSAVHSPARGSSSWESGRKGPPPPQPVNPPVQNQNRGYGRSDPPRGPPRPEPVNQGPPPPPGAHVHRGAVPMPGSPGTSDLFSSETESLGTTTERETASHADIYTLPTVPQTDLPTGVPNLATWARTLLVLPKYADKRWSYRRLLENAWNDKDILSYLRWIRSTYYQDASKPTLGKASDLAAFLLAVDYPIMERLGKVQVRTLVDD